MLHSIVIQDFILIEHLEVSFADGFVAITGESGAGKSIFVEAIGLLAGKRADSLDVRVGATKAIIEGVFGNLNSAAKKLLEREDLLSFGEDVKECIVRREILASGRGRVFVNDTPVSLSFLQELSSFLIDVHSQHQNLLLKESKFQTEVVDSMLPSQKNRTLYAQLYEKMVTAQSEYLSLVSQREIAEREYEYNLLRYNELVAFDMGSETQESLEQEERELLYAQDITDALQISVFNISGGERSILSLLHSVEREVEQAARYKGDLSIYIERISSVQIELRDIETDLEHILRHTSSDPNRLEQVSSKLSSLNSLYKKFNVASWAQLVALKEDLERRVSAVSTGRELLKEKEEELASLRNELYKVGQSLSQERREIAAVISGKVLSSLRSLGMPYARFEVLIEEGEQLSISGLDRVTFLFSANPDMALAPMADVASGGEMSRLMLSIKSLVKVEEEQPCVIFDEIDTGISGIVANRMGQIMRAMGQERQLLVITHLPQIAAKSSQHFFIYKEQENQTHTHLRELSKEERIKEIARLQSGENTSPVAFAAAEELLKQ